MATSFLLFFEERVNKWTSCDQSYLIQLQLFFFASFRSNANKMANLNDAEQPEEFTQRRQSGII